MTLERYRPADLDQLALRALDISARLRRMAQQAENSDIDAAELNAKKALEWLEKLERWTEKAEAGLQLQILRARGAALARSSRLPKAGRRRAKK